jgi:transcriptional regulator EpsA
MKEFLGLDAQDTEHLLVLIQDSLAITKRFQFFLWAQGALQRFLPHETLLCAHGDIGEMRFRHETFSSRLFDAQEERLLADPVAGLLPRLVDDWLREGRVPQMLPPGVDAPAGNKRLDFGHVAAHGPREIRGQFGSFFLFLRQPARPAARETYLLDLLMPYLHMALYRMLMDEGVEAVAAPPGRGLLSTREIQVLQWVKGGKTNEEIASILKISPLTVKNHVQKILRKLNVSNRAQAVGKGVALRLLSFGGPAG